MPPTTIEISKNAIAHNFCQFKKIVPQGTELMCVIKSNAYGHGMGEVADILKKHTLYFVVASIEEALALRKKGIKNSILVLGNYDISDKQAFADAIYKGIELAVCGI
jgi:alanine racemase